MQILLCKKSIERLGLALAPVLTALRDREHSPIARDCLDRCQRCELGQVIASADGTPMSAPTVDQLLADLDVLAADDA